MQSQTAMYWHADVAPLMLMLAALHAERALARLHHLGHGTRPAFTHQHALTANRLEHWTTGIEHGIVSTDHQAQRAMLGATDCAGHRR